MDNIKDFLKNFYDRKVLIIVITIFSLLTGLLVYKDIPWSPAVKNQEATFKIETFSNFAIHNDIMINDVTIPLEKAIANTKGLDYYYSNTKNSHSTIYTTFKTSSENSENLNALREQVSGVASGFYEKKIEYPKITKSAGEDSKPLLTVAFYQKSFDKKNMKILSKYLMGDISAKVQNLSGVASVKVYGFTEPSIRIKLNIDKIQKLNVSISLINELLRQFISQTNASSAGQVKTKYSSIEIQQRIPIQSLYELKNLQITPEIKLKDISSINISEKMSNIYLQGSRKSILFNVYKSNDGNPFQTVKDIKTLINKEFSKDNNLSYSFINSMENTEILFKTVKRNIVEASILVLIIVFLFTFSLLGTLIPLIAIPYSIISTFIVMKVVGLTFNPATLTGIILGIGLVVDDAMVVLENIYKKIKLGHNSKQSMLLGTQEIFSSIIIMTLTLAFVFLPVIFGKGESGRYLSEFAITITSCVLFSGLNSLTLCPILCEKLFSITSFNSKYHNFIHKIELFYGKIINFLLKKKFIVMSIAICLFGSGMLFWQQLKSETNPQVIDRNIFFFGSCRVNAGEVADKFLSKEISSIEKIFKQKYDKFIDFYIVQIQDHRLNIEVVLLQKYLKDKQKITKEILDDLYINRKDIDFSIPVNNNVKNVSFTLYGDTNEELLKYWANNITQHLSKQKISASSLWSSNQFNNVINFDINYNKIINSNIPVREINQIISLIPFSTVGKMRILGDDKSYPVWLGIENQWRNQSNSIFNKIWVYKTPNEKSKPIYYKLSDFVTIKSENLPLSKERYGGQRSFTCSIPLLDKTTVGESVYAMNKYCHDNLPNNIKYAYKNDAKKFEESSSTMRNMFIFAFVCIFLILSAQFESFIDGIIVMFTVPFAFIGAAFGLWTWGATINNNTIVGLITLIGLITKHGILYLNSVNSLMSNGDSLVDSLCKAGSLRLSPVLMTTLAMIFGSMPLLLSKEPALITLQQMSIVIVFGLFIGTILTLSILPIITFLFKRYFNNSNSNSNI